MFENLPIPESIQRAQRNARRQVEQYLRGMSGSGDYSRVGTPDRVLKAQMELREEEVKLHDELQRRSDLLPQSAATPEYLHETFQNDVIGKLTTAVRERSWDSIIEDIVDSRKTNPNAVNEYVYELCSALQRTFLCAKLLHQQDNSSFLHELGNIWECRDITKSDFKFHVDIWAVVRSVIETAGNQSLDPRKDISLQPAFIKSVKDVLKMREQVEKTYSLATRLESALEKLDKDELAKESQLSKSWFSFHTAEKAERDSRLPGVNKEIRRQFEQSEEAFAQFRSASASNF